MKAANDVGDTEETGTSRGLLFEIGTQVWNEDPRKTFHRWYLGPEVDTGRRWRRLG